MGLLVRLDVFVVCSPDRPCARAGPGLGFHVRAVQALPRTVMPQGAAPGEHVRSPDRSCAGDGLAVGLYAAGGGVGRHTL